MLQILKITLNISLKSGNPSITICINTKENSITFRIKDLHGKSREACNKDH